MTLALLAGLFLIVSTSRGENLASCAKTWCPAGKECRIVERCFEHDCQVGTTCLDTTISLTLSNETCKYDAPVLRSNSGGALLEITCGGTLGPSCPVGTTCQEPAGVCCTGEPKAEVGSCPFPATTQYYMAKGECTSFCRHDQECPGFQRCCRTGLGCDACMDPEPLTTCETFICNPGNHCVMTENTCMSYPCLAAPTCLADKAGTCPVMDKRTNCPSECKVDSHCQGDLKCCSAGGCSICVSPSFAAPSPFLVSTSSPPAPPPTVSGGQDPPSPNAVNPAFPSPGPTSNLLDTFLPSGPTLSRPTSDNPSTSGSPSTFNSLFPASPAPGASLTSGVPGPFSNMMTQWRSLLSGSPGVTTSGTGGTGLTLGSTSTSSGSTNPYSSMLSMLGSSANSGSGTNSFSTMMQNAQKLMSSIQQGVSPLGSSSSQGNLVEGSSMPTINNYIRMQPSPMGTNSLFGGGANSGSFGTGGGLGLGQYPPPTQPSASPSSPWGSPANTPPNGGMKCGMSCMMMFAMMPS